MTEFFILLKCTKETSLAVDAAGYLELAFDLPRENIGHLAGTFSRKAHTVLEKIEALIGKILEHVEISDASQAELLCYKTLGLVDSYGEYTHQSWKFEKQAAILRLLVKSFHRRGLIPQTHNILWRLQQLPNVTLTVEERKLYAESYDETSTRMRTLLDDYGIKVKEERYLCCENLFPAVNRAIIDGDLGTVNILLDQRAFDPPPGDIIERQALHVAAASNNAELVRRVLDTWPRQIKSRDKFNRTPLHYAASLGGLEIFKILLAAKANIEDRDKFTLSTLTYAAGGQLDVVRYILEDLGVNLNNDPFGGAVGPLHRAAEKNQPDILYLLLKHGARDYELSSSRKTAHQIATDKNFHPCAAALSVGTDTAVVVNDAPSQLPFIHRSSFPELSMSDLMSSNLGFTSQISSQGTSGWHGSPTRQPSSSQTSSGFYRGHQSSPSEMISFPDVTPYQCQSPSNQISHDPQSWYGNRHHSTQ